MSKFTIYPFDELGHANYGWLDARYHFSFNRYFNPNKMHIGPLRVWNDDTIEAGSGFPEHEHKNMEIITYVRTGAITHKDSLGNKGITKASNIQIMSAGSGVTHSEYNLEKTPCTLFQIWIEPDQDDIKPRWETKTISKNTKPSFQVIASGNKEHKADIRIYQKRATIWLGHLEKKHSYLLPIKKNSETYAVVVDGQLELNNTIVNEGDGIHIQNNEVRLNSIEKTQLIMVEIEN